VGDTKQRVMPWGWLVVLLLTLMAPSALAGQEGAFVIGGFDVKGERTLSKDRILALSGLHVGDSITLVDLREAVRRLWDAEIFRDVSADVRQEPDGRVTVVFAVDEAPIASDVLVRGNKQIKTEKITEALGMHAGDRLLPGKLAAGQEAVRALYEGKGYYLAKVDARPGSPDGSYRAPLELDVDEGRKVAISSIDFVGNDALHDGDLRGAMKTKKDGWLPWQHGEFKEENLQADLTEHLPRFAADRGYLDFTVVRDTFEVDPQTGKGKLLIEVREGPQYRLGTVTVEGNTRFPTDYLAATLRAEPGQVYSEKQVQATATELKQLYNNDGYIYAQIAPLRKRHEGETVVDLVWQIREGEPAEVQRIVITGNTVTHEKVIRRNLYIYPGDRFREAALIRSLNNLRNLRFFSDIRPDTRVVNEKGDIDLILDVKEQRTGTLNLGAALGGGTGLSGFLGYEQPNLFGRGKYGRVRWEFGSRNNQIELSYTEPTVFDSRASASLSFSKLNQRLRGVDFRQKLTGGSLGVSAPFGWLAYSRVGGSYSLREIDLQSDLTDERFEGYPRTESVLSFTMARDTRDLARNSTSGTRHEIGAEFAGGLLFGNTSYQKYRFETSWFMPTFSHSLVLNLRAKGGVVVPTGFTPLTEQFILGGVLPPSEGLRGYPDNSVGPHTAGTTEDAQGNALNDRGNAMLLLTAEHYFRINDSISTSIFFDAGNVWEDLGSADLGQYKRGAGVGLLVEVPGFGPIGFDYAYGFDRRDEFGNPDPQWQLHFKFGAFYQ
jgi:outer membrane protein insertion porin family